MEFKKGRTKTGGRRKGTPNVVSLSLRERVHDLLDSQFEKILTDLDSLEPKDRVQTWIKLLEFAVPKLQRKENVVDMTNLPSNEIDRLFDRAMEKTFEYGIKEIEV